MRVCLINPPRIYPKLWGEPNVFQPCNIAYVAAVLERQHNVHVIDAHAEGWKNIEKVDGTYRIGLKNKEVADRVKQWLPDMVGINIPYPILHKTAFEVASIVKSIDKDITIALDGLYPSANPLNCLANPNIDLVIIGEAENTWLELAGAVERGTTQDGLKKIKGIGFNKNGEKIITAPRPLIEDLDSLPFPARHLLPMDIYFDAVKKKPLREEISKPWTVMVTSRGCPYDCVYCSIHLTEGKKWRGRSPENVVNEIEELVRTYHIKQIDFYEANMALDKKRMETICDLIVERGLDIEWYAPRGLRADTIDEELLPKMKKSGCKRVYIAPESGVQRVVDQIIKKNQDLKEVEKVVVLCRKVGIKVACYFIIGLVGETKEEIEATVNYVYKLRHLGADRFYVHCATPIYGTELYEQAKRGGFLKNDFNDEALSSGIPFIETPEFTADDLFKLSKRALLVNPIFTRDRLVRAIRNPKKAIKTLLERMKK